ncbi:NUDIX hydrolase [mine drainage metagenome]|uniref:NUDIX hydrolase n=1 Tax=mine drainage metagenome TaxID=410659 RepID=T0YND5_9ZZZZ
MASRKSHKGDFISLNKEYVKINGKGMRVLSVKENGVVVILPFTDEKCQNIIIEYQYRPVLKKYIYELPAGHINAGETPKHAALRELQEETGFSAKKLIFMYKAHPTPGSSTHISNYFVATGLVGDTSKAHRDPDETIEVKEMSMGKVLKMIRENKIIDNKTISAVLYYDHFYKKH